MFIY
jgi:exocyst complex component 3